MYEYSKVELDSIVRFLDGILLIDPTYSASVKTAIKKTMNQNYKDETIHRKIEDPQNLRDSLYLLDKHVNNFMGIVYERIEMFNYNYLKNIDGTITITNPDPTSKSDLLHIHDQKDYSVTSCGPDVKFGSADYVVDEYIKKHLMNEESHGFIDITGYLKPEDYSEKTGFRTLNKSQNAKVLAAIRKYGYKPTIRSEISRMEFQRIFYYYMNYLTTGILPSEIEISDLSGMISSVDRNEISESEIRSKICVEQSSLRPSEIGNLCEEIRNANKGHSIKLEEATRKPNNIFKSTPISAVKQKNISTNEEKPLLPNSMNPTLVKVVKIAALSVGIVGGIYIAKNSPQVKKNVKDAMTNKIPQLFDKVNKIVTDLIVSPQFKKTSKAVSELNIPQQVGNEILNTSVNVSRYIPNIDVVAENLTENCKHIIADSISSFREPLEKYRIGQITKSEFYDKANSISNGNGKNLIKYLWFMVNVHKDKAAAELLDS